MNRDNYFPINKYSGSVSGFKTILENPERNQMHLLSDLTSCPLDGAYLVLSKIKDLVILFHSPEGCSTSLWFLWGGAFSMKSQTKSTMAVSEGAITLCTAMREEQMIYGGIEILKKAIYEVKDRYSPLHTIVLSSCCSNIIGDDIEGAVQFAKNKWNMNIDYLDTAGFKSWYWPNGYDLAHQFLVKSIMGRKVKKISNTVNLISYGNAASVDEKELIRLLNLCDIKVQLPLCVPFTSIENIKEAPNACLNIMMCKAYGYEFCKQMEKKYNIPFVETTQQIGSKNCEKFLREIGEKMECKEKVESLIFSEKRNIADRLNEYKKFFRGKSIAISAGHDKVFSLIELAQELGFKICYIGLLTYDDLVIEKVKKLQIDCRLIVNPQRDEEVQALLKDIPDLYLGPAGLTARVNVLGIPTLNIHFNDLLENYFGFSGVVNFAKNMKSAIENSKENFMYLIIVQ